MRHDTLLFDLDGTLADTDALHFEAFARTLAPMGMAIGRADYVAHILGRTNESIMRDLFPGLDAAGRMRVAEEKEACFRSLAARIEPVRGLDGLLAWAAREAIRTAVVTNAPRANAEQMLAGLGLAGRFDALVIGDELARGKPDPLPYATALALLGSEAGRAVAFEDSRSGVAAARDAGIFTFGLTTTLDAPALHAAGAGAAIADFADPLLAEGLEARFGSSPARG